MNVTYLGIKKVKFFKIENKSLKLFISLNIKTNHFKCKYYVKSVLQCYIFIEYIFYLQTEVSVIYCKISN